MYIINPYQHAAALADICAAFLHLFQKYIEELDKTKTQSKPPISDVILQVIPLSFVASSTSIVVPPQSEYVNLALEVYGRCPPSNAKVGMMGCAPPILLADPIPKSIDFKLVPECTWPFREEKCLHLAISQSLDKRWITAAWSDNSGSFQLALSYCVRARGTDVSSRLGEGKIRRDIWDTTREVIERKQGRWKVILVQTEPLSRWEIDGMCNPPSICSRLLTRHLQSGRIASGGIIDLHRRQSIWRSSAPILALACVWSSHRARFILVW